MTRPFRKALARRHSVLQSFGTTITGPSTLDASVTKGNRLRGALLGLAAGDAVGTTVEFKPRDTFTPVTDMVGGGPFRLPAGAWTDDTSMALCILIA